jgi:hypothetical protein
MYLNQLFDGCWTTEGSNGNISIEVTLVGWGSDVQGFFRVFDMRHSKIINSEEQQ